MTDNNDNLRGRVVRYAHGQRNHIMTPHEHGPFVRYDDLAAIVAERDALRADAARYRFCVDHAAWPVIANDGETWVMFVVVKGRRRSTFIAATATESIDDAMAAQAALAAEGRDG